jgi:hypothetical protein
MAEPPPEKVPAPGPGASKEDTGKWLNRLDDNVQARLREKEEANPMPGGQFGETVRALDKFYDQAELLSFPIVGAMNVLKIRFEVPGGNRSHDGSFQKGLHRISPEGMR